MANKYEKLKGIEVANTIDTDERSGKAEIILIDDYPMCPEFWALIGGYIDPNTMNDGEPDEEPVVKKEKSLFVISDGAGGSVEFKMVERYVWVCMYLCTLLYTTIHTIHTIRTRHTRHTIHSMHY